jgi:hypothetical protein
MVPTFLLRASTPDVPPMRVKADTEKLRKAFFFPFKCIFF